MSNPWPVALDALEVRIERQRAFVLGMGPLPDGEWQAPSEPLPAELRPRALTLAAACDDIESRLTQMMAARQDPIVSPYR